MFSKTGKSQINLEQKYRDILVLRRKWWRRQRKGWIVNQEDKENAQSCQMWEPAKGYDSSDKPTKPTHDLVTFVPEATSGNTESSPPFFFHPSFLDLELSCFSLVNHCSASQTFWSIFLPDYDLFPTLPLKWHF